MSQEAEARHEAAIKQTAADAAAAVSEIFAAQLRAILPPPELPPFFRTCRVLGLKTFVSYGNQRVSSSKKIYKLQIMRYNSSF
jgi:hypothetical protein